MVEEVLDALEQGHGAVLALLQVDGVPVVRLVVWCVCCVFLGGGGEG